MIACGQCSSAPAGSSAPADCGCGCQQRPGGNAFVRPRFFPGQLLTEDDLELLVGYTRAKSQLHNRFLYGAGVVSGLEVHCHPCGGGRVVVEPGYALDGCGNDIVVPAPQELDINRLVRELLRARMGAECGDPCAPRSKGGCGERGGPPAAAEDGAVERTYWLYVHYREQLSEPLAPYTTDEPCGAQSVQFSRIQEGHAFELRCEEEPPPLDMAAVMRRGLAPFGSPEETVGLVELLARRGQALGPALSRLPDQVSPLNPEDHEQARAAVAAGRPREDSLLARALRLEQLASLVVRRDLDRVVQAPLEAFETLRGWVQGTPQEVGLADELLEELKKAPGLSALLRDTVSEIAKVARAQTLGPQKAEPLTTTRMLLAGGVVLTPLLYTRYRELLAWLRRQLLTAATTPQVDCTLLQAVEQLRELPLAETQADLGEVEAKALAPALVQYADRLGRYVRGVLCRAWLPVPERRESAAVRLARLSVRDCQVVELCNLERQLIPSPAALRYWLGSLPRGPNQACCSRHAERPSEPPEALLPKAREPWGVAGPLGALTLLLGGLAQGREEGKRHG